MLASKERRIWRSTTLSSLPLAFCMYNRYVDGLATFASQDPELYRQRGHKVAAEGYVAVNRELTNPAKEAAVSTRS